MYEEKQKNMNLYLTYVMGIFFTLHMVLPLYINSSFLSQFISENKVGMLYTIGSALTVFAIFWLSRSLPRFGNFRTALSIILLEAVAVFALAFASTPLLVFSAFFLHFILTVLLALNLDVFIEAFSDKEEKGRVRGAYLTISNMAWALGPAIAGFLTIGNDFSRVYITSLLLLLPLTGILFWYFRGFKDPKYTSLSPIGSLKHVWKIRDLRYIFLANFVLRSFFALMVIYTPVYLVQNVGLSFAEVGIILTIMLSAYIIFEYPLGRVADTRFGEKEILISGFVLIALTSATLSFATTTSIVWWAAALFMTRVGGAMVESMAETYFFKKIEEGDVSDLSIFRSTIPLGYVVAPIIATPFLAFFSLQWVFLLGALIVVPGIFFGMGIRDTR